MRPAMTKPPALAIVVALQVAAMTSAAAQPGDERSRSLQLAALNELGILEYCLAHGFVDETVVSEQREVVERLAGASASSAVGSPEEEFGRAGFLAFGGRQGRFEESALAQGLTLKAACESRAAVALARTRR